MKTQSTRIFWTPNCFRSADKQVCDAGGIGTTHQYWSFSKPGNTQNHLLALSVLLEGNNVLRVSWIFTFSTNKHLPIVHLWLPSNEIPLRTPLKSTTQMSHRERQPSIKLAIAWHSILSQWRWYFPNFASYLSWSLRLPGQTQNQ